VVQCSAAMIAAASQPAEPPPTTTTFRMLSPNQYPLRHPVA
jgi:hypothetical protein